MKNLSSGLNGRHDVIGIIKPGYIGVFRWMKDKINANFAQSKQKLLTLSKNHPLFREGLSSVCNCLGNLSFILAVI